MLNYIVTKVKKLQSASERGDKRNSETEREKHERNEMELYERNENETMVNEINERKSEKEKNQR